jgi:hypothetical protein
MSRRNVKADNTFRYMCGIAWNMARKLQDSARSAAGGKPSATPGEAAIEPYERGRLDFARKLLDEMTQEERDYFLDQSDMSEWHDEGEPAQTEAELACDAVSYALNSARCNADWIIDRVETTLKALPDGIGDRVFGDLDALGKSACPLGRRAIQMSDALYRAEDLLNLPDARAHMDTLTEDERGEWLTFASAVYFRADLDPDRLITKAAQCSRAIKDGRYYPGMCSGRGEHIEACPKRSAFRVWLNEPDCCGGEHDGHLFCEGHLEVLMAGDYLTRSGEKLTVRDFASVSESDKVPF